MHKFVDGRLHDVGEAELRAALRAGTVSRAFVPVLCGSAQKHRGVVELLDAVVDFLPSPVDVAAVEGTHPESMAAISRAPSVEEPFTALVFKLMHDRAVGNIAFMRVYSGALEAGSPVVNASRGTPERIGRLMFMHARTREEVTHVQAGDICAALGLRNVRSGDTLTLRDTPVVLEPLHVPPPVVEMAVQPVTRSDLEKMESGLQKLAAEDPSLQVSVDPESGQTLLKGMGELHLEIVVDRLRSEHGVAARMGHPRVAYRETLVGTATVDFKHARQNGGVGQYAHVVMEVGPAPRGAGLVFENAVRGGAIPSEFIPAIEKGVAGAMARGVLTGHPVVDVRVRLLDGSTHVKDSSAMAFHTAGSLAFQEAALKCGVQLLEPVMRVDVEAPDGFLGEVLGDLASRRGRVRSTEVRGVLHIVTAEVPLARLFGYVNALRGRTQGRATARMALSGYAAVSTQEQSALVAAHA